MITYQRSHSDKQLNKNVCHARTHAPTRAPTHPGTRASTHKSTKRNEPRHLQYALWFRRAGVVPLQPRGLGSTPGPARDPPCQKLSKEISGKGLASCPITRHEKPQAAEQWRQFFANGTSANPASQNEPWSGGCRELLLSLASCRPATSSKRLAISSLLDRMACDLALLENLTGIALALFWPPTCSLACDHDTASVALPASSLCQSQLSRQTQLRYPLPQGPNLQALHRKACMNLSRTPCIANSNEEDRQHLYIRISSWRRMCAVGHCRERHLFPRGTVLAACRSTPFAPAAAWFPI